MSKIRDIWDKLVNVLVSFSKDVYLYFIGGMVVAAFFFIVLGVEGCVFPALFAGAIKETWDSWNDYTMFSTSDFFATIAGGLLIQLFVIIG